MKIDFVSDVACPWCAVGLNSLERALERIGDAIPVELHFEPFELNPTLDAAGADAADYLRAKYGLSPEQLAQNRANIRDRGAAVGFAFGERAHVWNTFDAHRLLHWAGLEGRQLPLKRGLLEAYHRDGENVSDHEVLVRIAREAGLDEAGARAVLATDAHAAAVRERERFYQAQGINGVPAVIVDDRYLISGGQPPEVYEQSLRRIHEGAD